MKRYCLKVDRTRKLDIFGKMCIYQYLHSLMSFITQQSFQQLIYSYITKLKS